MSKFKVGDKVKETDTGDTGIIVSQHERFFNAWWVKWDSDSDILWLSENKMDNLGSSLDLNGSEIIINGETFILVRK